MFYFIIFGWEWDAFYLHIANNIDSITVWIEWWEKYIDGNLSCYGVVTLVNEAECGRDMNITNREISLANGLKDKHVSISTHSI